MKKREQSDAGGGNGEAYEMLRRDAGSLARVSLEAQRETAVTAAAGSRR